MKRFGMVATLAAVIVATTFVAPAGAAESKSGRTGSGGKYTVRLTACSDIGGGAVEASGTLKNTGSFLKRSYFVEALFIGPGGVRVSQSFDIIYRLPSKKTQAWSAILDTRGQGGTCRLGKVRAP